MVFPLYLFLIVLLLQGYPTQCFRTIPPQHRYHLQHSTQILNGIKNPWRKLKLEENPFIRAIRANPLTIAISRIYSYFWWLPRRNLPFDSPTQFFTNSTTQFFAYRQVPRNLPPIRYIAEGLPDDFFCYGLPGNTLPYGNWDPCGFSQVPKDVVRKFRESELKHGRLAMLATVGCLFQEFLHPVYPSIGGMAITHMAQFQSLPIEQNLFYRLLSSSSSFLSISSILEAPLEWLRQQNIPIDFFIMFYFMMVIESFFYVRNWYRWQRNEYNNQFFGNIGLGNLKSNYENGNYGFDPLRLMPEDSLDKKWIVEVELNHCRLAMIAFIGIIGQEYLIGVPAIQFVQDLASGRLGDFASIPEFPTIEPFRDFFNQVLENIASESAL